jgi:hypothetical protein
VRQRWKQLQSNVAETIAVFSYVLLITILPFQLEVAFGTVMPEEHNVTKRNAATINLQLYNASTKASVVALLRLCGTTELRKAATYGKLQFCEV